MQYDYELDLTLLDLRLVHISENIYNNLYEAGKNLQNYQRFIECFIFRYLTKARVHLKTTLNLFEGI